jgi:hypothetical protein
LEAEVRTHTLSLGDRAATKLGAVDRSAIALKMKLGVNPRALIIPFLFENVLATPPTIFLFLFLLLILFFGDDGSLLNRAAQPRKKENKK